MATVGANNAAALGEKIVNCQYNFPSPNFWPIRILIRINKESRKNISFDKLGIFSQPGGGGLTESQLFCKLLFWKLLFSNSQQQD